MLLRIIPFKKLLCALFNPFYKYLNFIETGKRTIRLSANANLFVLYLKRLTYHT